jgi:hypothetical protein
LTYIAAIFGIVAVLLGGLWFLQGVGAVHMQPILCVADCEPLEGPSPGWAAAGLVVFLVGLAALWYAIRRWRGPRSTAS